MTTTPIREASSLSIRVNVPVSVPQAKHKEFKEALMELLFGYDRLRPEAVALVSQAGVDVEQLSRLSKPRPLGLCPDSTDYEFKPNARLAKAAKEAGLLFTGGGQVSAYMDFEYAKTRAAGPVNELHVSIGVPAGLNYPEALDDISEGLFGTCDLFPRSDELPASSRHRSYGNPNYVGSTSADQPGQSRNRCYPFRKRLFDR